MNKKSASRIQEAWEHLQNRVQGGEERKDIPEIRLGTATCGRASGALETLAAFREEISRNSLQVRLLEVGCVGHCYAEPIAVVANPGFPPILYGSVTPGVARRLVRDFLGAGDPCLEFALGAVEENEKIPSIFELPRFRMEKKIILEHAGWIDPARGEEYLLRGGYRGLFQALGMDPREVIRAVKAAGIRGLGGAGFPAGEKWETCRAFPGKPKYVVGNGDEGDPGAFMDRALLESDPFSVLEGMTIAGYAVGSRRGFLYVRAEYPLAVERARAAMESLRGLGLLGKDILNSGFDFEIELVRGAGAFVCGESTALQASIEGKRGMPRVRPPHSVERGLWGKPTLLNNLKTLAVAARVLDQGSPWFRSFGTPRSKGTVVFSLAGKIQNTGLIEVPMGTTPRELVFASGGGVPKKKTLKAIQIGGPSGGCLPASLADTPVDFDSLNAAGSIMGSGGMVILDEDDCVVRTARFFLDFTQKESCGKCTPCRIGTYQMLKILNNLVLGKGSDSELKLLEDLAFEVQEGSLCGLGQTAPNPVLSTLRYFRDEYEAHYREGRCPARACRDLIAYYILPEKCSRACEVCVGACPVEAIATGAKGIKVIDQNKCVKCGSCYGDCPPEFQAVIKVSPPAKLREYEAKSSFPRKLTNDDLRLTNENEKK